MPEDKGRAPSASDYFEFPTARDASGGRIPNPGDYAWDPEISKQLTESRGKGAAGAYSYLSAPAGAAVGTMLGGPLGGIVGAVTGGLSGLSARKYSEDASPPTLKEMGTTALGETAGQLIPIGIGAALKKGGPAFAEFLVRHLMSNSNPVNQEGTEAAINYGLKPTVGQSGSKLAAGIERLFAGGTKRILEQEQQGILREQFNKGGEYLRGTTTPFTSEEYGKQALNQLTKTKSGQAFIDANFPKGYPSKFFQSFYDTPERTRLLATKLGPGGKGLLKGDYFDNVISDKIFDPQSGAFKPGWLIDELSNPNSVTKDIYSAAERNGMMQFARAAQSVSPDNSQFGKWTIGVLGGRALLRLGGAALGGFTHSIEFPATEVGIEIGMNQFAKNVLMNPKYAAIAARLTKIPPSSYEAQSGMKTILRALGAAGGSAVVSLPNGIKQNVDITPAGKFKIPTGLEDNQ